MWKKRRENKCESKIVDSSNFMAERGTWPSPNRTPHFSKEQNDGRSEKREIGFNFYQSLQVGRSKYRAYLNRVSRGGRGGKSETLKTSNFNPDPFCSVEYVPTSGLPVWYLCPRCNLGDKSLQIVFILPLVPGHFLRNALKTRNHISTSFQIIKKPQNEGPIRVREGSKGVVGRGGVS